MNCVLDSIPSSVQIDSVNFGHVVKHIPKSMSNFMSDLLKMVEFGDVFYTPPLYKESLVVV